ncbi:MAG: NAD-dependent epimerase/dehydratase family protein [Candidatus Magasanikbacteria bacterium]|nr:NAD-dependent epimerase/dehydratase family protein [Candidatus Magasanikbacteria bacterium]
MEFKNILITGGAGFVGSGLALKLRESYPGLTITALDNLKRRGSELNLPRLREAGVRFQHGDIRAPEDLGLGTPLDLLIDCSAEPSVLAGLKEDPPYLINTNLIGTINCLELARRQKAAVVFLSTSRVYPIPEINALRYEETDTRFQLAPDQTAPGVSPAGIREDFPLGRVRSLYGATKLAAELLLQEYEASYGVRAIINRSGLITGPWQMGKVDQGIAVLWLARHWYGNQSLSYIGYGGGGKQVRDFMHVDDLFAALQLQLEDFSAYQGEVFNISGGAANSFSLQELTAACQRITGHQVPLAREPADRPNDIRWFIGDSAKFRARSGWAPKKNLEATLQDIYRWLDGHAALLKPILN